MKITAPRSEEDEDELPNLIPTHSPLLTIVAVRMFLNPGHDGVLAWVCHAIHGSSDRARQARIPGGIFEATSGQNPRRVFPGQAKIPGGIAEATQGKKLTDQADGQLGNRPGTRTTEEPTRQTDNWGTDLF